MKDLYDIHCHILPEVDDGAKNMEVAAELIRKELEDGISTIILTPHYRRGMFETPMDRIWEAYDRLAAQVKDTGVKLHMGCEYHVNMDIGEDLTKGLRPTLAGTRYVLAEFSEIAEAAFIQERICYLLNSGYYPVIAHIERCRAMTRDLDLVAHLTEMGCYMQVNADSIIGKDGLRIQSFCKKLIREDLLHFVASDAHDLKRRPPRLRECAEYLKKKKGRVYTSRLLRENPSDLIQNRVISV